MNPVQKKISCGVVGAGWWGRQMATHVRDSGSFHIISVYDPSREAAAITAKKIGCTISNSFEDLIKNPDITCIFIFSPNDSHPQYAIKAAHSGKHVFLEKPIANTVADAETIVQACKENQVILAVGHNVRHYGIFQRAKTLIREGIVGEIVYIEGNRSRSIGFDITEESWRFYKNSCNGGPLIQMAIHLVDAVRFISGLELETIKTLSAKRFLKTENDESFSINAKDKSGILLHLFTSYVLPESFYLNFHGINGILFVDPFNGLYLQKKDSTRRQRIKYVKNNPEIDEILMFYKSIIEQKSYIDPTPEEAVDNVRVIEQILHSY